MTRSGTSEKLIIISEKSDEIRRTDLSGERLWRQAPCPSTPADMCRTELESTLELLPVATFCAKKTLSSKCFLHMTWDRRVRYFTEGWQR